jgi:hypothetical protein
MRGRKEAVALLVAVSALSLGVFGAARADAESGVGSGRLGGGRIKSIQWEAWGEVTASGKGAQGGEEVCVTIAVLEPTEGSESEGCGPVEKPPFGEIVRTPVGVIAASMFAPEAKHVAIRLKGRGTLMVPLKPIHLRPAAGGPTLSYSYFSRGFRAPTCITRITALDARGKVVTRESNRGRCL